MKKFQPQSLSRVAQAFESQRQKEGIHLIPVEVQVALKEWIKVKPVKLNKKLNKFKTSQYDQEEYYEGYGNMPFGYDED